MSILMLATMLDFGTIGSPAQYPRAKQAVLFRCDGREQHRSLRPLSSVCERAGHLQQGRDPRRVVHGAVVDAIAVHSRADAEMIEVRLVSTTCSRASAGSLPGRTATTLSDRILVSAAPRARAVTPEARSAAAVFGVHQRQQVGQRMAGPREQPFGAGRIHRRTDLHPREVVETRIGERHHGIQTARGRLVPRPFHGPGIGNRDGADRTRGPESVPANACLLIVWRRARR